ncbi:MAG: hypothetical protein A3K83_00075 [Omnitrophica WOR_2 bacterium RBG_13_44_8b]|nr:MAG: hypothetical protein A3K83_00075 [Omnitrophica WOR_2 bacterium RBG_13_44_8b]
MEEALKSRLILILIILTVICFTGWLSSCVSARQFKSGRQEEISKRLDAEEKLTKFTQDKPAVEQKINQLEKESTDQKTALDATQKALEQEQLVNASLKEELQKLTKLKEALEEDLKEALVAAKQAKPKMR